MSSHVLEMNVASLIDHSSIYIFYSKKLLSDKIRNTNKIVDSYTCYKKK